MAWCVGEGGHLLIGVRFRSGHCLDVANNRICTCLDVNVFDGDLLLTFAAVLVEGVNLSRENRQELCGMFQILFATFKRLVREHGASQTLHGRAMRSNHLGSEHTFDFALGLDALEQHNGGADARRFVFLADTLGQPKRAECLVD